MENILTQIIELLTGGLTAIAGAIGEGLSEMVSKIFLTGTGETQSLSVFGSVIVIFAGVSLAIGLSRWVTNFVASLGN